MAQALLQRASLLAPDLIPLNYLIAATPESMLLQLVAFRTPWVAEGALRRRYITIFRTQSIVSVVLHNANERSCGHDDGAEEADQRRQIWLPPVARADEAAVPPAEVHSCHAHHQ